jgi:hypothetical protein
MGWEEKKNRDRDQNIKHLTKRGSNMNQSQINQDTVKEKQLIAQRSLNAKAQAMEMRSS